MASDFGNAEQGRLKQGKERLTLARRTSVQNQFLSAFLRVDGVVRACVCAGERNKPLVEEIVHFYIICVLVLSSTCCQRISCL